jgi:hypothetical protein
MHLVETLPAKGQLILEESKICRSRSVSQRLTASPAQKRILALAAHRSRSRGLTTVSMWSLSSSSGGSQLLVNSSW